MNTNAGFPVAHDEVEATRNLFQRVADTVTNASRLKEDVETLQGKFRELEQQIETLVRRNAEYEMLHDALRRQRDAANDRVSELEREVEDLKNRNAALRAENERLYSDLASHNDTIATIRRERDDAQYDAIQKEERASQAEATLRGIVEALRPIQHLQLPDAAAKPY